MSKPQRTALEKTEGDAPAEQAQPRKGWLSWAVGWVLVPATIIGVIFGGGVLVGVHMHDSWLARLIMWVAGLFS